VGPTVKALKPGCYSLIVDSAGIGFKPKSIVTDTPHRFKDIGR